jgi:hypothetical protein
MANTAFTEKKVKTPHKKTAKTPGPKKKKISVYRGQGK